MLFRYDVNSLSSAWLRKSTPFRLLVGLIPTRVWLGIYLGAVTSLTATKKFKYEYIFEF